MLKLVIADDERVIRQSLYTMIDWEALGISVVGLCQNGVEAYEAILDEYPDLVLTDIKMPGLTGLELIAKAHEAQLDTRFVILSGYADFEFAKEAMRYGVRHYLLKPTNPEQVTKIMSEARDLCYADRRSRQARGDGSGMAAIRRQFLYSMLMEALVSDTPLDTLMEYASPYENVREESYELCRYYYVPPEESDALVRAVQDTFASFAGGAPLYLLRVNLAVLFFYPSLVPDAPALEAAFRALGGEDMEFERRGFSSLESLLSQMLPSLRRFSAIEVICGERVSHLRNDSRLLRMGGELADRLAGGDGAAVEQLSELLRSTSDMDFLRLMVTRVLVKAASLSGEGHLTADLALAEESRNADALRELALSRLGALSVSSSSQDVAQRIKRLVRQNLSNSELSLKWLAENCLYMNVDYLSKQFTQKTGEKFSAYLTRVRVERAKELLCKSDSGHVYEVAQQVGCGNNPQYFSQIFKRTCKMTPTEYVRAVQEGREV